jgi:hypothetical protein
MKINIHWLKKMFIVSIQYKFKRTLNFGMTETGSNKLCFGQFKNHYAHNRNIYHILKFSEKSTGWLFGFIVDYLGAKWHFWLNFDL